MDDEQIKALRRFVSTDEGARLVLAVFQFRPQSEVNDLMHEYLVSQSILVEPQR